VVDEQDRPVEDAPEDTKAGTGDRALLVIGALFAVIGAVQLIGPASGGVAFLLIGLVFVASAGVRSRR
jgi:hypothetical protein